ncbi:hypothetical protein PMAYCL1PPCAC_24126 [Pristionchus mayeri]|uniref:Uncharacterized protein n=1 Tax=Pristionchus mayeri TaxID=1317129 RepID=A0AAN5CZC5_9BILA|nr:hypothetical protein PMAYCL1PPCAC_24126 [Pristionchus mayeri]
MLLLLLLLPSVLSIVCFTDIACLMLPHGEFACNNTALVDCTDSQACLSYYSAPDFSQSPRSWLSSQWTRRLRGCASDDVVTSLFDTATGWSARCGFGGERLIQEKGIDTRDKGMEETATIPILGSNHSLISTALTKNTLSTGNSSFPLSLPINIHFNETESEYNNSRTENTTRTITVELIGLLTNDSSSLSTQSSTSTITNLDVTIETTESSITSEIDPGDAIEILAEPSRRVRRDPMVLAGYAGCLCYSDGCNGPEEKYLEEVVAWVERRAVEAERGGDGVEVKTTDYEDTGAEPVSESG